jgi:lipopolysaccharide/colanic/teichoic acid biosynthesis glycosyltransferase
VPGEPTDGLDRGDGAVLSSAVPARPPERSGLPRVIEAPLALVGLVAVSPIIAISAAAVVVSSGLPAFFRQRRIGRGGEPFTLVKLRTMRPSRGGTEVTARSDARITAVGRFLRATKLDELPELWNVLRGDMSLVGPRPEVARYVDLDDPLWKEVLRARPGLTDPTTLRLRDEEILMAGIEGDRDRYYREALQPAKLRGYVEYLRGRTWKSDIVVIWDTILTILHLSRPGSA